jgi:hypothetical protein
MRIIFFLIWIFLPFLHTAQNVGIGTTTPVEKLEVKNPLRSTVKISSDNFDDTTELLLSNRAGTFGTDFSLKSIREEGLFLSSNSDLAGNISPYSMVVKPNGNIGMGTFQPAYKLHLHNSASTNTLMTITNSSTGADISDGLFVGMNGTNATVANLENGNLTLGTNNLTRMTIDATGNIGVGISPTAKLDINGGVKLEGLNIFEFGAGVAGKEVNAGKMGYNAFGQNGLVFVGGGTNSSNRAVYFFAEGGTTFSGPLNIGGTLQVNGNSGTAGQVLSSNGSSDPTWESMAFGNNIRFSFTCSNNTVTNGNLTIGTRYNTNPTAVVVSGTSITFNQTGIYHFDVAIGGGLTYPGALSVEPDLSVNLYLSGGTGSGNNPVAGVNLEKSPTSIFNSYGGTAYASTDLYITAGQVLTVAFNYYSPAGHTQIDTFGYLRGYLINE